MPPAGNKKKADNMRRKIRLHLQGKQQTQCAFANEINCSQTTFSRFMSGTMQNGSFAYMKAQRYFRTQSRF